MYKVKISKEVSDLVLSHFRENITQREGWELEVAEETEISTFEVWEKLLEKLERDAFTYHQHSSDIFLAIELYLPFILAYYVDGDVVCIFKAFRREQLFT